MLFNRLVIETKFPESLFFTRPYNLHTVGELIEFRMFSKKGFFAQDKT